MEDWIPEFEPELNQFLEFIGSYPHVIVLVPTQTGRGIPFINKKRSTPELLKDLYTRIDSKLDKRHVVIPVGHFERLTDRNAKGVIEQSFEAAGCRNDSLNLALHIHNLWRRFDPVNRALPPPPPIDPSVPSGFKEPRG